MEYILIHNRNTKCSKPIFRFLINTGFKGANRPFVLQLNAIDNRINSRYITFQLKNWKIIILRLMDKIFWIRQLKET